MSARFTVEEVFDLPRRGLTLAVGQLLEGSVSAGTTLLVQGTGEVITIAGVDLIAPPPDNPNRVSLIISSDSPTRPARGVVLIAP